MIKVVEKYLDEQSKLGKLYHFVMQRIEQVQLKQVASSLTLTSLLAVVPALAVIMAAFTAFPLFAGFRENFEAFLFSTLLPEQYSAQIIDYMKDFANKATGLTIFGVLGLGVTTLLCIATIDAALNRTFEVRTLRPLFRRFLLYWALLTLGPIVISLSLAATSYVTSLGITGNHSFFTQYLYTPLQIAIQGFVLALLYKYVPNCRVLWRDALIGGMVMEIIMSFFRWGFSIYVLRGSYANVYGAFAAVPVLLTWTYINWMLVLAGAALTAALPMLRAERYGDMHRAGNDLLSAIALIRVLRKAKHSPNPSMSSMALAKAIGSYPEAVDSLLERLTKRHYVVSTSPDGTALTWALLADSDKTTLRGVFEEFGVDTTNSILKDDSAESAWLESGMSGDWLNKPISQVFSLSPEPVEAS